MAKVEDYNIKTLAILICTYNSGNTILDTLNSLIGQETANVDLIISDDCSSDDTIKKVRRWVEEYGNCFQSYNVLESKENTGITLNAIRGMNVITADFIKILAGDDIFVKDCISTIIKEVNIRKNENVGILVGKMFQFVSDEQVYSVDRNDLTCEYQAYPFEKELILFATAENTRTHLRNLTTVAPGTVFNKKIYDDLGGFDPKYKNFEDLPYFLKCLRSRIKISYIDKYLVYYRKSSKAVTNTSVARQYTNLRFYKDYDKFYRDELRPMQVKYKNYDLVMDGDLSNIRTRMIIRFGHNEKGLIYKITKPMMLLSPAMIREILKRVKRKG